MAKPVASYLPPAGPLNATLITWECGREMHRVHDDAYPGDQFNPNSMGNARFSPIHDTDGVVIPTLYAGTTFDCALMETIFHDLPFKTGFKPISKRKMVRKAHTIVRTCDRPAPHRPEYHRASQTWYRPRPSDRHDEGAVSANPGMGRGPLFSVSGCTRTELDLASPRSCTGSDLVWYPRQDLRPDDCRSVHRFIGRFGRNSFRSRPGHQTRRNPGGLKVP